MSVEVPEGWERCSLAELSDLQPGFAFKSDKFADTTEIGLPLIRIRDLKNQTPEKFIDDEVPQAFVVHDGDILVGMDGEFRCVTWRGGPAALNQRVLRVFNKLRSNKSWLHYRLAPILAELESKISGTTVKHLSTKDLKNIQVATPPLPEQQRIAEILSSVDESIRATEAVIAQAERVKRGLMEDLLTGGLGSAAIANGEVPEGWKKYALEEVIQIDWGDTNITKKSYVDEGFVAYSAAGGDGFLPHFDYDGEGIVVSAIGANSGRMFWADGKWSAIKNTMVAFPKSSYVNLKFFFYYAQHQDFWPISGGAQPFIGLKNARMARLVIPDAIQQDAAVRAISSVDDQITANLVTVEQLHRLKRGLMDDLLTGKVRTVA